MIDAKKLSSLSKEEQKILIKQVIQKLPLKLYVGGEGELLPYYQDFVKKNGLDNSVIFLGKLRDEEVVKNYNACDVFVLPSTTSLQEGFGLVALEAMACKKAVIVSAITGVANDVKKHNAGVVVAPCNINELSDALHVVLSDAKLRMGMANNAYGLVNNKYTWDKHAAIVEKEYLKSL
jgi:glycosyltransferase involved in cell wall biosynthesis